MRLRLFIVMLIALMLLPGLIPTPSPAEASIVDGDCGRSLFSLRHGDNPGQVDARIWLISPDQAQDFLIINLDINWRNWDSGATGRFHVFKIMVGDEVSDIWNSDMSQAGRDLLKHVADQPPGAPGFVTAGLSGTILFNTGFCEIAEPNTAWITFGSSDIQIPITSDEDRDGHVDDVHCDGCDKKFDEMLEAEQEQRRQQVCAPLQSHSASWAACKASGLLAIGAREGRGFDCWYHANRNTWVGYTAPENAPAGYIGSYADKCGFLVPTLKISPNHSTTSQAFTVTWSNIALATPHDWLIGYREDGTLADPLILRFTSSCLENPAGTVAKQNGSCQITMPVSGRYFFRLRYNGTSQVMATSPMVTIGTITGDPLPPTTPSVSGPGTVSPGGNATISWSGVQSPTTSDMLFLYRSDGSAPSPYVFRLTTNCTTSSGSGDVPKASGSCSIPMPTTPGGYYIKLRRADGTELARTGTIQVSGTPATSTPGSAPTPTKTSTPVGQPTATPVPPTPTAAPAASVSVSPTTVAGGSAVRVAWSGVANPSTGDYLVLTDTNGTTSSPTLLRFTSSCTNTSGSPARASGFCDISMPGTRGDYQWRLKRPNGSIVAISNTVTVFVQE